MQKPSNSPMLLASAASQSASSPASGGHKNNALGRLSTKRLTYNATGSFESVSTSLKRKKPNQFMMSKGKLIIANPLGSTSTVEILNRDQL